MGSKINIMTIAYTAKIGLKARYINVKTQKINSFTSEIFGIILKSFQIENKLVQG